MRAPLPTALVQQIRLPGRLVTTLSLPSASGAEYRSPRATCILSVSSGHVASVAGVGAVMDTARTAIGVVAGSKPPSGRSECMVALAALVFCSMHAAWWHSRAGSTLQPDVDLQHPERVLATRRRVDKLFYDCMIRAECQNGSCRRVRVTGVGCAGMLRVELRD